MKRFFISYFLILISFPLFAGTQTHVRVVTTADGWRIETREATPTVLAYGTSELDPQALPPAFEYMLERYEEMVERQQTTDNGQRTMSQRRRARYSDIANMVTCHWAQGDPFNRRIPPYRNVTSHPLTGCVATAMAQVLYTHRMPRTMHGIKTYSYTPQEEGLYAPDGSRRVTLTMDFGSEQLDWANMTDSPWNRTSGTASCTEAEGQAVATLMYACGVAASMNYGYQGSGALPSAAAEGINTFFDGLRAEHIGFDEEVVLNDLRAGNPVIYSAGGHCFVIGGATAAGYFYCNLGWGGDGDGYYLPTDMAGYNTGQSIVRVWKDNVVKTYSPVAELQNKYASALMQPATSVQANRWYILWNSGRCCSPLAEGLGATINNTSLIPQGESTSLVAPQLVRFVPRSGNTYYIQNGLGHYWGSFTSWGGTGVTTSGQGNYFSVGTIAQGYFSLNSNGQCYLDCNGAGSTVVGWTTVAPTDIYSNSSWILYPVELSDNYEKPVYFDQEGYYTLQNSGHSASSEGYLVATAASVGSKQVTLQGVQRAVGATSYEKYRDEFDTNNPGAYWQFISAGGANRYYLKNALTGNYLCSENTSASNYILGGTTPLVVHRRDDGTLSLIDSKITQNAAQGFLCASTHPDRQHPAAFWSESDAGSYWIVAKENLPVPLTAITLGNSTAQLMVGGTLQLNAVLTPENTTEKHLNWTSSNTAVATVNSYGTVTAVGVGTTTITVASQVTPTVKATCVVTVSGGSHVDNFADFSGKVCYTMTNPNSGAYLVSIAAADAHPTVRGVSGSIANAQAAYYNAADLSAAGSYWQVVKGKEGSKAMLYNLGVQKYLAFSDGAYVFTDTPTELYLDDKGLEVFSVNWGTGGSNSYTDYLALNVGLDNPASKGGASAGLNRYWKFSQVTGVDFSELLLPDTGTDPNPKPDPKPDPDPEKGDITCAIRLNGTDLYFSTEEVVDNAPVTTYSLQTDKEIFVISPAEGVSKGFYITSMKGKKVGHSVVNTWDFSDDASIWTVSDVTGNPAYIYKQGMLKGFGVNDKAAGMGVFTDKSSQLWVIEPVLTGVDRQRMTDNGQQTADCSQHSALSSQLYDLQGRSLAVPRRGVMVTPGRKKMIR